MMRQLRDGLATLRMALATNRPMRWALWWQLVLLLAGVIAMPFDRRLILGISPWIKPMKFELSVIAYLLTITLLLHGVRWHRSMAEGQGWQRSRLLLSRVFATAMTIENTLIALQSARGVRSHMNYTTPLDGALFGIMGVFILVNTIAVAWLLWMWSTSEVRSPAAVTWGVRLGLLTLLAGSMEGFLIVANGGHTVGAQDGLAGLPFVNWSSGHGDLRVAHFFALHALQLLPLAGLFLSTTRLQRAGQMVCLFVFTGLYLSGVWWSFAQAMKGQPVLGG